MILPSILIVRMPNVVNEAHGFVIYYHIAIL